MSLFTTTTVVSFVRNTICKILSLCRKSVQAVYVLMHVLRGIPVLEFYSPLVTLYSIIGKMSRW